MGTWRGRSEMDELITAVSAPIYDDNNIVGVLRYVSSLEPTYKVIIQYMMVTALVGVVVICVAFVFGRAMSKRILIPIQEPGARYRGSGPGQLQGDCDQIS